MLSILNHSRSVTREIRKERWGNFQQFIGRLPKFTSTQDIERLTPRENSKRLNTTNYMLSKQIRNFDV